MAQPARRPRRRAEAKRTAGERLTTMVKSELQDAALHGFSYLETMIDPASHMPERVPDEVMATSAIFKSPNTLILPSCAHWDPSAGSSDAKYDGTSDGETNVALFPGTNGGIWHTLGAATNVIAAGSQGGNLEAAIVGPGSQDSDGFISHALRRNENAVIPRLDSDSIPRYEIQIGGLNPADPIDLTFHLTNTEALASAAGAQVVIIGYNQVGGIVGTDTSFDKGNNFFVDLQLPAQIHSFSIQVIDEHRHGDWAFSIAPLDPLSSGTSFDILEFSACGWRVVGANGLDSLDLTQTERTTALSGLVTYMGSTLQDGGVIAAARLPMGTTPIGAPNGDYYNFLASLPFYNDNYALRCGAYCWWAPDSEQEYFFRPYFVPRSDDINESSSLWYSMNRDDPTQDVRLQVTNNIEVTTRSIQYSSEVAPSNASFSQLLAAIKILAAVTENPTHREVLGRLLKSVKAQISKPENWLKLLRYGTQALKAVM